LGDITKKVRLIVNAVYSSGVYLFEEREFVGDSRLLQSPSSLFRCLEIRIMVPVREAEELATALRTGEVELNIQDIPSRMES
jgi:hypothetical protein